MKYRNIIKMAGKFIPHAISCCTKHKCEDNVLVNYCFISFDTKKSD